MINIISPVGHAPFFRHLALMLYAGPDQMLPLLSFLGAALGLLLMWWQRLLALARRMLKSFGRKPEISSKNSE